MDLILDKFQDFVTCSVLKQFPIYGPILINLLAKMAIINNGKANLRSWYFCVQFKASMDGAMNTSRQIAGSSGRNIVRNRFNQKYDTSVLLENRPPVKLIRNHDLGLEWRIFHIFTSEDIDTFTDIKFVS